MLPSGAWATIGECDAGDAPATPLDYTVADCESVCTQSGSELICDLATLCGTTGAEAWVVTGYGASSHDVSAFGRCASLEFCCVFDEGSPAVDTVTLKGTNGSDDGLSFTFALGTGSERNLEPWDADPLDAFIQGLGGADEINGSNYAPTDYDERLQGGGGADVLYGNGGGDFLTCGDGDDTAYGGAGNDVIWGGDDSDSLFGETGSDKLCDGPGFDYQATGFGALMDGGEGEDKLWYDDTSSWTTPLMHADSDAGPGYDYCGDDDILAYPSDYPDSCDLTIDVEPTLCAGQN